MAISKKQLEQRVKAGISGAKKRDMVAVGRLGGRLPIEEQLKKDLAREAEEATRRASRRGQAPDRLEIGG